MSDGFAPLRNPVVDAVEPHVHLLALRAGIVGAQRLDGVAIAARPGLGHHDAVVRLVGGADAGKADLECHECGFAGCVPLGKEADNTCARSSCQAPCTRPPPRLPAQRRGRGPGAFAIDRGSSRVDRRPSMLKAGIVGLPNVGKSTLFNALTRSRKAEAANYPFCTINPNVGVVTVPDDRLEVLRRIAKTDVVIPAADRVRGHRGTRGGRQQGRGPRQPVPGDHPRGGRDRARRALLRGPGRRSHDGLDRPSPRHRGRRDRAGPVGPGGGAEADGEDPQEGEGGREGGGGRARPPRAP